MLRFLTQRCMVVLFLLCLAACSAKPGPEAVAQQVVTALDQQDVATLNTLLDTEIPYKDITLPTELRFWHEREDVSETWEGSLGPFQTMEVQPATTAGASTIVHVLLHHRDGEAAADLTMHETSDGWRVLAWGFTVLEKRKPTS